MSTGEPTIHPRFCEFLETVYNTRVVPNYTTNGIILSDLNKAKKILEYTKEYCGGVAVSFSNHYIRSLALKAIENLLKYGGCKVIIHHIISDNPSVDEFINLQKSFGPELHYHVLLPLMKHGRSNKEMNEKTYLYMVDQINHHGIKNVAFGANFAKFMKTNPGSLNVWEYPKEIYSKNIILGDDEITITPSSFNLEPIWNQSKF